MYLWRKRASPEWWAEHEAELQVRFAETLAVIEQPNYKRLQIEVTSKSANDLLKLARVSGGRVEKLSSDWLQRIVRKERAKPLKIGKRLVISRSDGLGSRRLAQMAAGKPSLLVIPASAAFGTGEHGTTAMSLRMLERLMRSSSPDLVADLGTGSGILALSAKRLGVRRVIAIDNDPIAISVAKQNARLNRIRGVEFEVEDVLRWKLPAGVDIVTANLFSELLIEVVPKLSAAKWLILSGILREQEAGLWRALRRFKIEVEQVRRRGKWVALLAAGSRKR